MQLDKIDRQIYKELFENGRISLTTLNKKIIKTNTELMSHSGIKKRISKLGTSGVLKVQGNLNIKKLNYHLMFILLEMTNYDKLKDMINCYNQCPRVFFLAHISGQYNVIMGVVGQSRDVLHRFINYCGPSNKEGILHTQTFFVSEIETPLFFPLKLFSQKSQESKCGNVCEKCEAFMDGKCEGCGKF
jgi:DNA-binding Lrp family transcriptional regulator